MSTPPTNQPQAAVPQSNQPIVLLRGLGGAIVGGVAGYVAFYWLWRNGFYGIMVVGVLLGLGAGLAARSKSVALGILCAILAFPAGVLAEWHVMPFQMDKSLAFFVMNLPPLHWLFIAFGTAAAYWFGQGR